LKSTNPRIAAVIVTLEAARAATMITQVATRQQQHTLCFKKKRAPYLFLRLLCVLLTYLKNIWQYYSKGNLQENMQSRMLYE